MQPEQAISSFASAVLAPQSWPDALESVAGACHATMVTVVNTSRRGELNCSRNARPAIDLYLHGREVPDSRIGRVKPTLAEGFRTDYDDFSPHEIAHDPYYQEFLAPLDVRWHATAALTDFDERIVISFKRSARQGPFERHDLHTLNQLRHHLRAAARQSAVWVRSHFEGELSAFSRLRRGALWLDEQGHILAKNARVEFGDGLLCDGGRLSAAHADDRSALAQAISHWHSPPGPVIVRRPSGKRPYIVDLIDVPAGDMADPKRTRCIALVNDLDAATQPARDTLQRSFALTPRETDLALALCRGATLHEAAAQLQISELHARQRLKALMAKTGSARQSDMLVLLARLNQL